MPFRAGELSPTWALCQLVSRLEPEGWVISFNGGKGIGSRSEFIRLSRSAFINVFVEWAGGLTTERISPAEQPLPRVGSRGDSRLLAQFNVPFFLPGTKERPFGFLSPNFISVFQFTFISVCVFLCSKPINVSRVGSGANSHLTHPLSIKALLEKVHHASLSYLLADISISALKISVYILL